MSYGYWKPYVPVAKRRAQAEKAVTKAKKAGKDLHPVCIEGRAIAKTFWGRAWCDNLEAYSDFENRLPRGRTYVRNGSVIDLKIEPGKVRALVVGSSLYQIEIGIAAVSSTRWKLLARECADAIASLVELLQGKLSKAVMERICQPKTGLFPTPKDIQLGCSCPDWATMCKHVAAVLYGVGARLDAQPELLFMLRQVDPNDLVTQAAEASVQTRKTPARGQALDDSQLSDVFGIEMDISADLPETKKKAGTAKSKAAQPSAAASKTPAKKKTKTTTLKKSRSATDSRVRKARVPSIEKPAAVGKSTNSAPGKSVLRKLAANMPAHSKRKKS
ncbi:MAG: hypothetical protein M0Z85_00845 [Gammaproteobacteria bacterium]|jgi:uncharacterized Zn finger protein|uniref:SWIM zinc finger family protein n=1 Tax=Acidiferrobacter sp. SPIII_3 TaxID=1281578 RepID=UPI00197A8EF8|nr:hypothetical protein [Acidiferrobacter sp. SPIII_3]MDA8118608.1 hypothetical protein [Gammaproteobacteria bacterium]